MYETSGEAPVSPPLTDERLSDQYAVNLAVLDGFGFSQREIEEEVPSFELIRDALRPEDREWIGQQTAQGYAARLTIAPSLQAIGLEGERHAPGLIPRFDINQASVKKGGTRVSKTWRTYGDKHPVHDNGLNEKFSAAILLKPSARRELPHEMKDASPETILRSTAEIKEKKEALDRQHFEQARLGRHVLSAPAGHIISDEAQSRYAGERGFHHDQASCLAHYPITTKYQARFLPTISRDGRHKQRLDLNERTLLVATEAVLRVLHLPLGETVTARK
ncbi:MAG TPA: hypothetical protein VFH99_00525 [Candidatus Saccharimonadales bacterium]|nr:hypothetical protein [Candidatus Saccharimonadales bacterium]